MLFKKLNQKGYIGTPLEPVFKESYIDLCEGRSETRVLQFSLGLPSEVKLMHLAQVCASFAQEINYSAQNGGSIGKGILINTQMKLQGNPS